MIDPWERRSERVRVAPLAGRDVPRLRRAIQGSVDRIATWGPTGLESLDELVDLQGPAKRTFLVHAVQVDPTAGHALAAVSYTHLDVYKRQPREGGGSGA